MRFAVLLFFISLSGLSHAKVLDKVVAVVDDKIMTLSQAKRTLSTLDARRNISPQIYTKNKLAVKDVVQIFVRRNFIRNRLGEIGYIIGDEQVESQIKSTEKRLGLNRKALLQFLKSNNISFDEYFEIIRETIEFNIFSSRVIVPLISVTDQEIKNTFYQNNSNNKTLSFKYNLVDFSMDQNSFKKGMLKKFKNVLVKFQTTGVLPEKYSSVTTNVLGDISADGLTANLKKLLNKTNEGSFSEPVLIGNQYHVFFVKGKDVVESEIFMAAKERIRAQLLEKSASSIAKSWFDTEEKRHYVKYFF